MGLRYRADWLRTSDGSPKQTLMGCHSRAVQTQGWGDTCQAPSVFLCVLKSVCKAGGWKTEGERERVSVDLDHQITEKELFHFHFWSYLKCALFVYKKILCCLDSTVQTPTVRQSITEDDQASIYGPATVLSTALERLVLLIENERLYMRWGKSERETPHFQQTKLFDLNVSASHAAFENTAAYKYCHRATLENTYNITLHCKQWLAHALPY